MLDLFIGVFACGLPRRLQLLEGYYSRNSRHKREMRNYTNENGYFCVRNCIRMLLWEGIAGVAASGAMQHRSRLQPCCLVTLRAIWKRALSANCQQRFVSARRKSREGTLNWRAVQVGLGRIIRPCYAGTEQTGF